jgi:hypothetical protein
LDNNGNTNANSSLLYFIRHNEALQEDLDYPFPNTFSNDDEALSLICHDLAINGLGLEDFEFYPFPR